MYYLGAVTRINSLPIQYVEHEYISPAAIGTYIGKVTGAHAKTTEIAIPTAATANSYEVIIIFCPLDNDGFAQFSVILTGVVTK